MENCRKRMRKSNQTEVSKVDNEKPFAKLQITFSLGYSMRFLRKGFFLCLPKEDHCKNETFSYRFLSVEIIKKKKKKFRKEAKEDDEPFKSTTFLS